MFPQRREEDLLVRSVGGEMLVYDLRRAQAHCLNQSAAAIWHRCDGRTSVAELAAMLAREWNAGVDEALVWITLRKLHKAHLLKARVEAPYRLPRISRRALIRALGVAAAVPVIMTIVAPEARAQASDQCTGLMAPCSSSLPCPGTLMCADRGMSTCSCG